MTFLDNLSPEDLLVLTNAITISLSKDKTADELNVLGNFIVGICLMLTVASQQQYLSSIQQQQQANKSNSTPATEDDTIIG